MVRALYRAAVVPQAAPPYHTLTVKVFYPALHSDDEQVQATGVFPADAARAPFPVMIFFPGVNCESTMYYWLAQEIAEQGVVVLVMTWIAENLTGRISLTPGIDLAMVAPERYGTGFTSSSLPILLKIMDELGQNGTLAGLLDTQRIILAGHSAGGTLALQNADRRCLPGIAAAISYMANPLATTVLGGFAPGVLPPLPSDVPTLMIGGTADGIGTHHNTIYGRDGQSGADTVRATFDETFSRGQGDSLCVILQGATHYSVGDPLDQTTGRAFLDTPQTTNGGLLRGMISQITRDFIGAWVQGNSQAVQRLAMLQADAMIAAIARK